MGVRNVRAWLVRPVAALHLLMSDTADLQCDATSCLERNGHEGGPLSEILPAMLIDYPEFRNVYYYRLERGGSLAAALTKVARRLCKPRSSLDIACDDIGPGLVISHGDGTILTARRIGARAWIHHQVTVGWEYGTGCPELGDDVFIGAGAKILGQITIGDGARIGANAVVLTDVPPGATAVGVPARIIPAR